MKDQKIEEKIKALIEQPCVPLKHPKIRIKARDRDSLSQIIRTKEQADEFMEKLHRAFNRS